MTARESAIQSCEEWFGSPISNWDENQLLLVEIIQEAILAERVRCAKITNDLKKDAWDNMQCAKIANDLEMIAEIIRKGGTF